ncbi:MAG: enoyl-CoA hydratase/isomerase family protein [Promethearchaeota archaeon]
MNNYNFWILTIDSDGIANLRINNIPKMNAFTAELSHELGEILTTLKKNPSIRMLVLKSATDKFFSAGADMDWFMEINGTDAEEVSFQSHNIFGQLEKLPFPVIAAIKGLCLTAGLELIMCADMIYASENAKFGQIECKYGITPGGGGTQRLTRLVGPLHAKEMIFTGRIISAEEAKRIGLVNDVFSAEEFDEKLGKICDEIFKNSQNAISECKMLIEQATYTNYSGFHSEEQVFGKRFASGEPSKRLKFVKDMMNKKNK